MPRAVGPVPADSALETESRNRTNPLNHWIVTTHGNGTGLIGAWRRGEPAGPQRCSVTVQNMLVANTSSQPVPVSLSKQVTWFVDT